MALRIGSKRNERERTMKRTRFIAIALAVLMTVAFVSCDGDNATPPQKECEHDWNRVVTKDSTCAEVGEAVLTCTKCGEKKTEEIPLHHYVNYKCKDCSAWGKGPAGGYVFYDCDADNDRGNSDGLISTECGWRFLEAAPADLRLIKGVPTVDSSADGYDKATKKFIFGYYWESFTSSDSSKVGTSTGIGTGKKNTEKLVEVMGTKHTFGIQTPVSGAAPILDYAARLCDILVYTAADGEIYDDWFLPSFEELKLVSSKFSEAIDFSNYYSSSESGNDQAYCYCPRANPRVARHHYASIRPIRSFLPET